jgi:hypothetical protein
MKILRLKTYGYQFIHYRRKKLTNFLKRVAGRRQKNSFLFILCPPYSGSTLLNELISTSSSVSVNNDLGTREGQQLPKIRKIMFDHNHRWNIDRKYDWRFIKREWLKYWDVSRPILLEKSPPNVIRALEIQAHFKPAYFICMVRNPYATCEGLIRRNHDQPGKAARFIMNCYKYQKKNVENLEHAVLVNYEELTENTKHVADRFAGFLPGLSDINIHLVSRAHNYKKKPMPIKNMNYEKITKLKQEQLSEINSVFEKDKKTLDYFGYEIIQ